jgi:hypothetical protein
LKFVRRPDGTLLTPGSLPPTELQRWVKRRKADIVMAVRGGILSMEAACSRSHLSREEYLAWQKAFDRFGIKGLSGKGEHELQKLRRAEKAMRNRSKMTAAPPSSSPAHADGLPCPLYKRAQNE